MSSATLLLVLIAAVSVTQDPAGGPVRLRDDFERGLAAWEVHGSHAITVVPSDQADHGAVLRLTSDGKDIYVLARGSERWGAVRIEGDVLFRGTANAYLGIVYHHQRRGDRVDFGNVYIKGNGSYLRVNPHRDGNIGRTLYEEYRTPLVGQAAVRANVWQRFRAEVMDSVVHMYVADTTVPQLIFSLYEGREGAIGFQPRSVGDTVWVDNVVVTSIDRLTYRGAPRPPITYQPESLLTDWEVVGPLDRFRDSVAGTPDTVSWRAFPTDARGVVVTGRVAEYAGPRSVAYFRTRVRAGSACRATLHLSTVDDLAIWVNGRFWWFLARQPLAWHDFWRSADHAGRTIPVYLVEGENELTVRVRGGVYGSGGFFARIEDMGACNRLPEGRSGPSF